MKKTLLLIIQVLILTNLSFAQSVREEQYSLTYRHHDPIKVDVVRNNTSLDFTVQNDSFFPYQVEIEFTMLVNLQSYGTIYKLEVRPGKTRMLSLKIIDVNNSHNYAYKVKHTLGPSINNTDLEFPYLFPVARGKRIAKRHSSISVVPGDTIFAMRKGIVTATPDNKRETDRIMKGTLEVYHNDGTIGIYQNIDLNSLFVTYGQKVYPGQPVGIVHNTSLFNLTVLRFLSEGKLSTFPMLFVLNETDRISSQATADLIVQHPESVLAKELSKSELKRLKKGTLFRMVSDKPESKEDL